MSQWVKDPALSLQQLGSLPWHRFDSWPGNLYMRGRRQKKKVCMFLKLMTKLEVLNLDI